jgi:hypothetical protein
LENGKCSTQIAHRRSLGIPNRAAATARVKEMYLFIQRQPGRSLRFDF